MREKTFYLLNLGCAKNLVEGEHLAGTLMAAGLEPVSEPPRAGLLMVNTCGFLSSAAEEAVAAALELARGKGPDQRLVLLGCLVGRYGKKLVRELPEVDLFVMPGELPNLRRHLAQPPPGRLAAAPPRTLFGAETPRVVTTGPGWAYLRIADGCPRGCSFCTIPAIRGRLRSRPLADVEAEARELARSGAKELNLIAQDLTAYGLDLAGEPLLPRLIKRLGKIREVSWLRLLYMHPDFVGEPLLLAMAASPKAVPYLDMPLQHIADPVLKAMGRRRGGRELRGLIARARELVPDLVLRTTLMTGHPGEGEAEFAELAELVASGAFDHLGVFAYSPEAGTRSARLKAPEPELAEARAAELMEIQRGVSSRRLAALVGTELPVLVLGPHPDSDLVWHGRAMGQAPEVDGVVIITDGRAAPGAIAPCRITAAHDYDLEGVLV